MPQFDVYRVPGGYAIDCQSDLMRHLDTRLVAPLSPRGHAPKPAGRLNPEFTVEGETVVMITQFVGVVAVKFLTDRVTSLANHDLEIKSALDLLISGY